MQIVSGGTPPPRPDLFAQVERRLRVSPAAAFRARLEALVRAIGLVWRAGGEHVRVQARLLRRDLFLLPLLLLPLAVWIAYGIHADAQVPEAAIFLAVLISALSKAFLYGQEVDPPREMVLATPTSPGLVLAVRCGLVFGYDLLINCGLVLPFLAWQGAITLTWFLESWLAPIFCLSAAALLLSVLFSPGTAVVACALLWALRLLDRLPGLPRLPWQPGYEAFWQQAPLLIAVGSLAVGLAFVLLERKALSR
jgi:hypothetical protein